jgi:hypothetical protein
VMKLVFALTYFISESHAVQIAPVIEEMGKRYGQDPYLISAVIRTESRFSRTACHRGAYGYMQIQSKSRKCSLLIKRDWKENIRRGVALMSWWEGYCTKHHKGHHWLLHYNQGFGKCPKGKRRCKRYERTPITSGKIGGYARRVLRTYRILKSRSARANEV